MFSGETQVIYQYLPDDPIGSLANYGRVEPYDKEKDYVKSYVDADGYEWVAYLHIFRVRDDEKSTDRLFIAKEAHTYIAYKIRLTEDQRKHLEPYCNCPFHTKDEARQKHKHECSCCMGCLYTEFPSQANIMEARGQRVRSPPWSNSMRSMAGIWRTR